MIFSQSKLCIILCLILLLTSCAASPPKEFPAKYNHILEKAENGDPVAQHKVSIWYEDNEQWEQAAYWRKKAAEGGDVMAKHDWGWHLHFGKGVKEDRILAAYWHLSSVQINEFEIPPYHYYSMGRLYEKGHGLPKNIDVASQWFLVGAKRGGEDARKSYYRVTKKYWATEPEPDLKVLLNNSEQDLRTASLNNGRQDVIAKLDQLHVNEQLTAAEMANECRFSDEDIEKAKAAIRIKPIIVDKSGLYDEKKEKISFAIDKSRNKLSYNERCEPYKKKWRSFVLEVSIEPRPTDYKIEINPSFTSILVEKSLPEEQILEPEVVITGKTFRQFNANLAHSNKNLKVIVKELSVKNDTLVVDYVFDNLTSTYMQINDLSLYVGDAILSEKPTIKLPPNSTSSIQIVHPGPVGNSFQATSYLDIPLNKTKLKDRVLFGVAAKYDINGKTDTLYQHKSVTYQNLLQ